MSEQIHLALWFCKMRTLQSVRALAFPQKNDDRGGGLVSGWTSVRMIPMTSAVPGRGAEAPPS